MARLARFVVAGLPHLVLHEGHNGQVLYRDDVDRDRFRAILDEAARTHRIALHAYGLADSRVALLVTPQTADGFSRGMQMISGRYAASFNRRHERSGALWNGRFRATVIEPEGYLLAAMRYVETLDGAASSLARHAAGQADPLVDDHPIYWSLGNTPFEREAAYRSLLDDAQEARKLLDLDAAVRKGWAAGTESFIKQLAEATPRRAMALKPGRPRRAL